MKKTNQNARSTATKAPMGKVEGLPPTGPVQVDRAVYLAARLRETLTELANLRGINADLLAEVGNLRKTNAQYKADQAQTEIDGLDADYNVGAGTVLQKRPDGTIWRMPQQG